MIRRSATYALLGLWAFICLFPLYWLFTVSLKSGYATTQGFLPFGDFRPNLEAWHYILFDKSENFVRQLINSLVVSLAATALTVMLAALCLYGLTRFGGKGHDGTLFVLLASRILPPVAIVIPLYLMARPVHLLDTRTLLVLVYGAVNLPVALWLLRPVIGARASDQEEAARLDGASHGMIFREVVLPAARLGLAASGIVVFILCWNEYLIAAVLAGDQAMTVPPFLASQLSIKEAQASFESEELARFSAATILVAIPAMLLAGAVRQALMRVAR